MDPYRDIAAYYDCEHEGFHQDVDFYREIMPAGPVLEIGAGTGRITAALTRAGFEVWAVDSSAAMLDRARRRLAGDQRAHLVESSLEQLSLDRHFATALLPLNTLWHFATAEQQLEALRRLRTHLTDGALLVIDTSNPLALADRAANGASRLRFRGTCQGQPLVISSAAWDDEAQQTLTLALQYDTVRPDGLVSRVSSTLLLRYVYRAELDLMLRLTGFRPRQTFGSYDLETYQSASPSLLSLAEAV